MNAGRKVRQPMSAALRQLGVICARGSGAGGLLDRHHVRPEPLHALLFHKTSFMACGKMRLRMSVSGPAVRNSDENAVQSQLAGSLPFFLQATAAKWFQEKKGKKSPNPAQIGNHMVAVMSPYFAQWWRHFTACERELLLALTHKTPLDELPFTDIELSEAARRLLNYGLLVRRGEGFRINGSITSFWIRQHAGKIVLNGRTGATDILQSDPNDPAAVRQALVNYFDLEELRTLCFDLGVDFDELKGSGKVAKARELVQHWQRHGNLDQLVDAIHQQRGTVINLPLPAK